MSKPILLLDIDGCAANFSQLVIDIMAQRLGITDKTEDDIDRWDTLTALGVTDRAQRDVVNNAVREPGACLGMRPYPGAAEGVIRLRDKYDVRACTAPFPGSRYWHAEREEWCLTHLGIAAKDVIFTHDKSIMHGDVIVDDKPENIEGWEDMNPLSRSIAFERPWNRTWCTGRFRVRSWDELLHAVGC